MSEFRTSIKTNYAFGRVHERNSNKFVSCYTTRTRKTIVDGSVRKNGKKFASRLTAGRS